MTGPLVRKTFLKLTPPSPADPASDLDRLLRALKGDGIEGVRTPLSVAAALPGVMRESGFEVTASIASEDAPRLVAVGPGDTTARNLGLAIDLGTTNVVGALVDLQTGAVLAETSRPNPQIVFGEDILTRIHHCLNKGGLAELQAGAASCITEIAKDVSARTGVLPVEISCVSVSGNTTMAHLFLGIDPYNICRAPYTPAANHFGFFRAAELGLSVNPEASGYVLPNVGSYVGGDVLAGILVSGMHTREGLSILVDVGTNAEIVIGNRDWLLVCAGAAGPALEGGVVRFGMRAMPGAIERVAIDPDTLLPAYSVIGGLPPVGLCGSALIDLVAELFTTGIIDGRGKFVQPAKSVRVVEYEGRSAYIVVPASESGIDADIIITEMDIDNLVRTKAAMFTALYVVTRELGVRFDELESFSVAGTFGQYIAADKAVAIGMVPDIEPSRFRMLGNTSLMGAREVLCSTERLAALEDIAGKITYKELNVSTDFMSEFRAAMFLPHTDGSLFKGREREDVSERT